MASALARDDDMQIRAPVSFINLDPSSLFFFGKRSLPPCHCHTPAHPHKEFIFSTSIHPSSHLTVASTHNPLQGYENLLVAETVDLPMLISLEQLLILLTTFRTSLALSSWHPISWFLSHLSGVSLFSSFFSP